MNLRQAIVFAILMENNDGIIGKAPSYIEEKKGMIETLKYPERMLDANNLGKFKGWQKTWKLEFEEEKI